MNRLFCFAAVMLGVIALGIFAYAVKLKIERYMDGSANADTEVSKGL